MHIMSTYQESLSLAQTEEFLWSYLGEKLEYPENTISDLVITIHFTRRRRDRTRAVVLRDQSANL